MIKNNLAILSEAVQTFTWKNPVWFLYLACILYIAIFGKKEGRRLFIWPLILQALTIFNPLLTGFLVSTFGFENRFLRFFWMLVYYLTIGYTMADLAGKVRKAAGQWLVFAMLLVTLGLFGIPVFAGRGVPEFQSPGNEFYAKNDALQLSPLLHSEDLAFPRVLYNVFLVCNYRTYDPAVYSVMSREDFLSLSGQDLETYLSKDYYPEPYKYMYRVFYYGDYTAEKEKFLDALKTVGVDYIVESRASGGNGYYEEAGLLKLGETTNYIVWKSPAP